jgi:hypothetical protein
MPIQGQDMTLWPEKRESWWERALGSPFELRFFARDFLTISCDGCRVEIQPHYFESTFDTFWVDTRGVVRAQALGGLFPFTLGKQKKLLRGLVVTLGAVARRLLSKDEEVALLVRAIHAYLREQSEPDSEPPRLGVWRAALANRLWAHKLRRWQAAP